MPSDGMCEKFSFEKCKEPAKILYSGLKDRERYAVCLVGRYFEKCTRSCLDRQTHDALSLDQIFIWTNFYKKKEKLSSACCGENSDEPLDWFRILCCFLDERRLKTSLEVCLRKKNYSKVTLVPIFIPPSHSPCDISPLTHSHLSNEHVVISENSSTSGCKRSLLLPESEWRHKKRQETVSLFETQCSSQHIPDEPPYTLEKASIPVDSSSELESTDSRPVNGYKKSSSHLHVAYSDQSSLKDLYGFQGIEFLTSHCPVKQTFLESLLYRWSISVLNTIVKQEFGENSLQHKFYGPRILSCGQLTSLYQEILKNLSWVFDFRVSCIAVNKRRGKASASLLQSELILPLQCYIQQMNQLEVLIVHCFFSNLSNLNLEGVEKESSQTKRSPNEPLLTKESQSDVKPYECCCPGFSRGVVLKLEKDALVVRSINLSQEINPVPGGWRNPSFFSSVINQCLSSGMNGDLFTFESWVSPQPVQWVSEESSGGEATQAVQWRYEPSFSALELSPLKEMVHEKTFSMSLLILGAVSLVWDVVGEFWTRLNYIIEQIMQPPSSDLLLQEIRLMTQTMVISKTKPGWSWDFSEYPRLFDQLEMFLTSESVPLDIVERALKAWSLVEKAQELFYRIQKENEDKKKASDEQENALRRISMQETEKREQQRHQAVEYVKKALEKEKLYNISNPFWLIGIPPCLASSALLSRVKRKLSLLLHPDKCLDPKYKADAQLAFTMVTEAFTKAEEMCSKGTHLLCCPPKERPPFAEEVGIPLFSSSTTSVPHYTSPFSRNTMGTSNFNTCETPSTEIHKTTSPKSSALKFEAWSASEFNDLIDSTHPNDAWPITFQKSPHEKCRVEAPRFITHSSTKSNIWVSIPEKQGFSIRVFFSRPWPSPHSAETSTEMHYGADGVAFFLPRVLSNAVGQCSKPNTSPLQLLAFFSCVLLIHSPSLNISEWITTHKDMIQPVLDSKRKSFSLYIAAQTIDTSHKTLSEAVWVTLPPRKFTMPSTKPRVIKLLQLFHHAPENYRVLQVLSKYRESSTEYSSSLFPLVKEMTGWTYSTLCAILQNLMQNAAQTTNDAHH